jgi:pre-mRNA-splicing factor CWC26
MSISAFVAEDKALKAAAMEAAVSADGSGHTQEDTVYRDKRGRKLDMLNEMMRQQAIREGKAVAEAKEQYEWGKGTVQKEIDQRAQDELANIASEPFARSKDDARLDAMLRSKIHADDPMAQYMQEKEDTRAAAAPTADGKPRKPRYKGPAPQPNRFGIMPGYRWDGRDRGNGWEATVANAAAAKVRNKDAAYQWSTSDM